MSNPQPTLDLPETALPLTDERLSKKIKQRMCVATREVGDKDALLRFVLAPDGSITLDLAGKLPGRGASLTPTKAALEQAIKTKAFTRAFKQNIDLPEDFGDLIRRQMEAALLARLSMARKGGDLALGQDAIFAASGSGKLCLLILPKDLGGNALAKLQGIARDFPSLAFSDAVTLGEALGKERAANVGFTEPYRAEQFLTLAEKFRDFLDLNPQTPDLPEELNRYYD